MTSYEVAERPTGGSTSAMNLSIGRAPYASVWYRPPSSGSSGIAEPSGVRVIPVLTSLSSTYRPVRRASEDSASAVSASASNLPSSRGSRTGSSGMAGDTQ